MQVKTLVFLYWDCQNVRMNSCQTQCILDFANERGDLICKKAYAYWRRENEKFEKDLYDLGFDCINVPSSSKNSLDEKLIHDCQGEVFNNSDAKIVIVISGDKDFKSLVNSLKATSKKVVVFARQGNASKKMKAVADEFYYVDNFCR